MKKIISHLYKGLSFRLLFLLSLYVVLVFFIINYVNIHYFANRMEGCIRDQAVQASNMIKKSTRVVMMKNQRDELAEILNDLVSVSYIEGIRIYDKKGIVQFSGDSTELFQKVDMEAEQCVVCHQQGAIIEAASREIGFRDCSPNEHGHRLLGLINPIENDAECYNSSCHAHKADDKILGLLDIKVSLERLEHNKKDARFKSTIIFIFITILSLVVFARIINIQIQQPIEKLVDGTRQVAEMQLDHIIEIKSPEEMGNLADSFNKMTQKLKHARDQLRNWSDTLEERVNEKTEELKKTQDQLIMVEKLASMGKLSAIVAHEINNPLSGILTYAKLLIRNLKKYEGESETIKVSIENLKIIRDESERCGNIVKNLLLFSKKSVDEQSENDLKVVINKSIDLLKHSIDMKGIELIKNISPENTFLYCDAAAMEQMLVALLINAVEACPKRNGSIRVILERLQDKNMLILEIADNGYGISEDALPRIFEPFFSTKNGKSVGLGLSVVYGIVERHNGSIDVKSAKGKGTTFIVRLPQNPEQKTPD